MNLLPNIKWSFIHCPSRNLQLSINLTCGQAFRWRCLDESTLIGVFSHRVWQLKQDDNRIYYRVLACPHWNFNEKFMPLLTGEKRKLRSAQAHSSGDTSNRNDKVCSCHVFESQLLHNYLQLDISLDDLYRCWSERDKRFAGMSSEFSGLRVLQQEPVETLLSFLCSVNNSISRIVPMIQKMCTRFGEKLLEFDGVTFHDFPALEVLSSAHVDKELRELGFGYRAPFIAQCSQQIIDRGGENWMKSLTDKSYDEVWKQLIELPGVGMKVADCVCLMSLGKPEAVPVDTHVRQIADRDYGYQIKVKSLTNKAYKDIGDFFRSLWGSHAGWAQAVLFVADTKRLPKLYSLSCDLEMTKKRKPETFAEAKTEPKFSPERA